MGGVSKIVIAPASFKGLLTASEAASAILEGLKLAGCSGQMTVLPMADGGTGTVEAIASVSKGEFVEMGVPSPLGAIINARYFIMDGGRTAVMESVSAVGLHIIPKDRREPLRSASRGIAWLIKDAVSRGCKNIVIGLGDSGTVDIGCGMLSELGVEFLDSDGSSILPLPENFQRITKIDAGAIEPSIRNIKFTVFSDVTNPATGPKGSIRIFGPQKGLSAGEIRNFEPLFAQVIGLMERATGIGLANTPMTGSAGGLGAAFKAFLGAELLQGAGAVAKAIGLERAIQNADVVITGEGKLDAQSVAGKVISEVAGLAKKHGKGCIAVVGCIDDMNVVKELAIDRVIEISHKMKPVSGPALKNMIIEKVRNELGCTVLDCARTV